LIAGGECMMYFVVDGVVEIYLSSWCIKCGKFMWVYLLPHMDNAKRVRKIIQLC
jgi:hypothetical protein